MIIKPVSRWLIHHCFNVLIVSLVDLFRWLDPRGSVEELWALSAYALLPAGSSWVEAFYVFNRCCWWFSASVLISAWTRHTCSRNKCPDPHKHPSVKLNMWLKSQECSRNPVQPPSGGSCEMTSGTCATFSSLQVNILSVTGGRKLQLHYSVLDRSGWMWDQNSRFNNVNVCSSSSECCVNIFCPNSAALKDVVRQLWVCSHSADLQIPQHTFDVTLLYAPRLI